MFARPILVQMMPWKTILMWSTHKSPTFITVSSVTKRWNILLCLLNMRTRIVMRIQSMLNLSRNKFRSLKWYENKAKQNLLKNINIKKRECLLFIPKTLFKLVKNLINSPDFNRFDMNDIQSSNKSVCFILVFTVHSVQRPIIRSWQYGLLEVFHQSSFEFDPGFWSNDHSSWFSMHSHLKKMVVKSVYSPN